MHVAADTPAKLYEWLNKQPARDELLIEISPDGIIRTTAGPDARDAEDAVDAAFGGGGDRHLCG
jgi:hypothetical protein